MAICDDIMALLQRMSDRLEKLEEKVESLSIGEFKGTISTQEVKINQGKILFDEGCEVGSLSVTNHGNVQFESDVQEVTVNTTGDVEFNGEVENCSGS